MTVTAPSDQKAAHRQAADGLLDRIAGLHDLLAKNAAQGEADRRVTQESIDALREAGAFKVAINEISYHR